jgi:hypothetical protein
MSSTTLQASNGLFVCAENGGGGIVVADRPVAQGWETFDVERVDATHVAFKTYDGKHYVCAEEAGARPLVANRTALGPWETFEVIQIGDGKIALKAVNGRYVCAESGGGRELTANRDAIGPWETFAASLAAGVPGGGGSAEPLAGSLHTDGRFWRDERGDARPRYLTVGYGLADGRDPRPLLDQALDLGFNGFRVFAGHLEGRGQTAASARARLPWLLEEGMQREMRVAVSAITDTRSGRYDLREHVGGVADICRAYVNADLELANEPEDDSQKDLSPERLRDLLGLCHGVPTALGASANDESTAYAKYGDFATSHLDRGRDMPNQFRRVREMLALAEAVRKPVRNNEPLGAAEPGTPGQRYFDPGWGMVLGALNRLFEIVGVFHSEDGLNARVLGPNQVEIAKAYIAGVTCFPNEARLTYQNSNINGGWGGSPNARFDPPAVRFYCGVAGNRGIGVAVGGSGNPQWQGGWRSTGTILSYPQGTVYALER